MALSTQLDSTGKSNRGTASGRKGILGRGMQRLLGIRQMERTNHQGKVH